MAVDLAQAAKQKKIRYFLISFVDLFGVLRAKLVPAQAIAGMQEDGAGFAAFAAWLDSNPAEPDMLVKPDPATLIQLPWKPEVGWLAGDCWMNGEPMPDTPRLKLKSKLDEAKKKGYRVKTGVEAEYFLVSADGTAISDPLDTQAKPCYDQAALMRRYDVVSEICDAMLSLGWGPYQNDHEDANGQFEMNWDYDDALITADRHVFFKYMVKSLAEKHGLRATFMPKPFSNLTGNGCHAHVSIWNNSGKKNLFHDAKGELGISQLGYQFLGGIIHRAPALCAIWNPTVNSYKRINAPVTLSGATWSPNLVAYGGQQPLDHGAHSRRGALRAQADGWRRQPLSVAGGHRRRRARRHRERARPRRAHRPQPLCRGPQAARRPQAAAQPARRAQALREGQGRARGLRRELRQELRQAQDERVERVRRHDLGLGAQQHPRLLS